MLRRLQPDRPHLRWRIAIGCSRPPACLAETSRRRPPANDHVDAGDLFCLKCGRTGRPSIGLFAICAQSLCSMRTLARLRRGEACFAPTLSPIGAHRSRSTRLLLVWMARECRRRPGGLQIAEARLRQNLIVVGSSPWSNELNNSSIYRNRGGAACQDILLSANQLC